MLAYDIETEPLSDLHLAAIIEPLDTATMQHPGQFDPAAVKLGNVKNPQLRAEKIEAARVAHAEAVSSYDQRLQLAESQHFENFRAKAALDATTGRISAVGFCNGDQLQYVHALNSEEYEMLIEFWDVASRMRSANRRMVGHCSNTFDLPFIVRRSWIIGVTIPSWIFTPTGFINPMFGDTNAIWQAGNRREGFIKLNRLARALGVGAKTDSEECTGADFSQLLRGSAEEYQRAIAYFENDLWVTWKVAEKLAK